MLERTISTLVITDPFFELLFAIEVYAFDIGFADKQRVIARTLERLLYRLI